MEIEFVSFGLKTRFACCFSQEVVIASAVRTPIGSFRSSLCNVPAPRLGAIVVKAAVDKAGTRIAPVICLYFYFQGFHWEPGTGQIDPLLCQFCLSGLTIWRNKLLFKELCLPVKPNCLPAENVSETHIKLSKFCMKIPWKIKVSSC